jgi:hypothetical protein
MKENLICIKQNLRGPKTRTLVQDDDRVNYKTVFSSDRVKIGKVEAAFADSFIAHSPKKTQIKKLLETLL